MNRQRNNNKIHLTVPCRQVLLISLLLNMPMASVAGEMLGYDLKGNIVSRQNAGGTTNFQYDSLDRLTGEQGPQATQGFSYDANGNRLTDGAGSEDLAARIGVHPKQLPVIRHRARKRLSHLFADELRKTVGDEKAFQEEWRALVAYMP